MKPNGELMTILTNNSKSMAENYVGEGFSMRRDKKGKTPNGNPFNNRWVLRDCSGKYIDHDQSRNDLAERNEIKLVRD